MLSYRHAFHAGNHADVLKHLVLVELCRYLGVKDKPFWYIDTHAGAGRYALESPQAARLGEYRQGIGRLWECADLPRPLADYVDLVRRINPSGRLQAYPGSPLLALWTTRVHDRLWLCERHSREVLRLRETFARESRRVSVDEGDGFAALKGLLPPAPRRALVLIDPAYEEKGDYGRVVQALRSAVQRFPGGTYLVWYPQLVRREACELPQRLKRLPVPAWLEVTLRVQQPAADGFGMHGSGVWVVNPPWTLRASLQQTMPRLVELLGVDGRAGFTLDAREQ